MYAGRYMDRYTDMDMSFMRAHEREKKGKDIKCVSQ